MAHNEVADLSAERLLDIVACEENLDHYARAGDARSCRDIGLALARALLAAREELNRRDQIHEADEAAILRTATEPDRLRGLAEWLVSLDDCRDLGTVERRTAAMGEAIRRAREALGQTEEG